jgi:hypothetical protein
LLSSIVTKLVSTTPVDVEVTEETKRAESPINPLVVTLEIDAVDRANQPVVADLKEALVIKFVRVIINL